MELFRAGLTTTEVYSVVRYAKCNKYHHPSRPRRSDADGDLWREVLRASQSFNDGGIIQEPIAEEAPKIEKPINFLTLEERAIVAENRSFIDVYVDWASKKTDAANQYQIASAFTVLSSCFSDSGHAIPKYGKWA